MYRRCSFMAASLLLTGVALAGDKSPDPDLLEFLGSVDSGGQQWSDYLEKLDLDKVARPATPSKPVTPPNPVKPVPPPPGAVTPDSSHGADK